MQKTVLLVKLASGEEVIAKVLELSIGDETVYRLEDVVRVVLMPPQVQGQEFTIGFSKYVPYITDKHIVIEGKHVLFTGTPEKRLLDEYNNIFSGLVKVKKPDLILPANLA